PECHKQKGGPAPPLCTAGSTPIRRIKRASASPLPTDNYFFRMALVMVSVLYCIIFKYVEAGSSGPDKASEYSLPPTTTLPSEAICLIRAGLLMFSMNTADPLSSRI